MNVSSLNMNTNLPIIKNNTGLEMEQETQMSQDINLKYFLQQLQGSALSPNNSDTIQIHPEYSFNNNINSYQHNNNIMPPSFQFFNSNYNHFPERKNYNSSFSFGAKLGTNLQEDDCNVIPKQFHQQPKVIQDLLNALATQQQKKQHEILKPCERKPFLMEELPYQLQILFSKTPKCWKETPSLNINKNIFESNTTEQAVDDEITAQQKINTELNNNNHHTTTGIQWLFEAAKRKAAMDRLLPLSFLSTRKTSQFSDSVMSPLLRTQGSLSPIEVLMYKPTQNSTSSPLSANSHISERYFSPSANAVSAWNFILPEDSIDEEFLFRRDELQRRKSLRYLNRCKKLHDLHIVMPICVPGGRIEVDDPLGANYYTFNSDDKYIGARILFGKGITNNRTTKQSPINNNNNHNIPSINKNWKSLSPTLLTSTKLRSLSKGSSSEEPFAKKSELLTPIHGGTNASDSFINELKNMTPACDVWASFLHIRLGTIYNLNNSEVVEVVDRFKTAFDKDLCYFYVPIAIDCRGLYPSTDELISQRAGRALRLSRGDKNVGPHNIPAERYETRGYPTTDNDIKRLRMLKRHLKRFALDIVKDLGFNRQQAIINSRGGFTNGTTQYFGEQLQVIGMKPSPCIELHENCRTSTITNGSLKIIVREWSLLEDPEVFKKVWNGHLSSTTPLQHVADEVWAKLLEHKTIPSARALLGEIRLEHNHLRMVDPRWPDELILGRRIADYYPHSEIPSSGNSVARFIFCNRIQKPNVLYAYAPEDGNPRETALSSRLGGLFKVHLEEYPDAATSERKRLYNSIDSTTTVLKEEGHTETTAATEESLHQDDLNVLSKERKDSSCCSTGVPKSLQKLMEDTARVERIMSDQTTLGEPIILQHSPLAKSDACKFFLHGGCARANKCFFLHPADPSLESKIDVRQIVPRHPKFF